MFSQERLRQLGARVWKPILSLVGGVLAAVNGLKAAGIPIGDLPGTSTTTAGKWTLIGAGAFVFVIVRFPQVAFAITRLILGPPPPPSETEMIFRGPVPYDKNEKLPSRQRDIEACWIALGKQPFCILEGESGCGKSSVLNAGIVPRASAEFNVIECRIADDPFGKLHAAVRQDAYRKGGQPISKEELAEAIAAAASTDNQSDPAGRHGLKPLLICIDQFEELFATVKDDVRIQFLQVLKDSIRAGELRLLVALRSDFFDLLMKICDVVDPEREALNLENYYTLRAFRREQAEDVLAELLAPIHKDNPMLEQQIENFTKALVRQLLRPPRDKRLSRDDEKTVLPVELQTVGMVIESSGASNFSTAGLKRLGGKLGLLKAYIEDAKTFVWRKTAVSSEKALLILRQLISPAQTKWIQTPTSIAIALSIPPVQVKKVLDAFADKYLVRPVPAVADGSEAADSTPVHQYELMHEHLVQILREAPEPFLQKARDAEERLRFWSERIQASDWPRSGARWRSVVGGILSVFAQPIPLAESVLLWRFARSGDERHLLRKSLLGFVMKLLLISLPIAMLWRAWEFWTSTDAYQARAMMAEAPIAKSVFSGSGGEAVVVLWARALTCLGKLEEANTIARERQDPALRTQILAAISEGLMKAGRLDDSRKVLDEALGLANASDLTNKQQAFGAIAAVLLSADRVTEALSLVREKRVYLSNPLDRARLVRSIARAAAPGDLGAILKIDSNPDPSYYDSNSLLFPEILLEMSAQGRPDEAIALIPNERHGLRRAAYLQAISIGLARNQSVERAQALLSESEQLQNQYDQEVRLRERSSDYLGASFEGYLIVRTIQENYNRARRATIKGTAESGRASEALAMLRRYRFLSDTQLVALVTEKLAKPDQVELAIATASPADRKGSAYSRTTLGVVIGLARAGQTDDANRLFDAQITGALTVGPYEQEYSRASRLKDISIEMARAGQLEYALNAARRIENDYWRSETLSLVLEAQPTNPDQMESTLAASLNAAREISDFGFRSRSLTFVAMHLTRLDKTLEARNILDEAHQVARQISNDTAQSKAYAAVAVGLANLRSFKDAHNIADLCSSSVDRLGAYAAILTEYAKQLNPTVRDSLKAEAREIEDLTREIEDLKGFEQR